MGRILVSEASEAAQATALVFPENLAIDDIEGLKHLLGRALQSDEEISLDPRAIKTADTASVQLLAAFVNRANALNKAVNWTGFSEVLSTAATLLGLRRHLGLTAGDEPS